jgi:hypothetical protein
MTDIAEETLIRSTGNVFADLDLAAPAELAVKSTLLGVLQGAVNGPDTAARLALRRQLEDDEVQAISGGDPETWTVDRLVELLDRMGLRVTVSVSDANGAPLIEREIVAAAATADTPPRD